MQENTINAKPEKAKRQKYSPQFKDQALERAKKEGSTSFPHPKLGMKFSNYWLIKTLLL